VLEDTIIDEFVQTAAEKGLIKKRGLTTVTSERVGDYLKIFMIDAKKSDGKALLALRAACSEFYPEFIDSLRTDTSTKKIIVGDCLSKIVITNGEKRKKPVKMAC